MAYAGLGVITMRCALYARVSTSDKDQNPDTQLLPLREFCRAQGWTTAGEFVDHASATDLRGRTRWRSLLEDAARRKVDVIVCWKLDRCFRSVAHMANVVEDLRRWNVGLRSYSEPWLDTSGTSPAGDLMLNILASFAQFEKALIAERVKAGMARARKQGKTFGRRRKLNGEFESIRPLVESGQLSLRKAATMCGVGKSTIARMVSRKGGATDAPQTRVQ